MPFIIGALPIIDVERVVHFLSLRARSLWRDIPVCPRTCQSSRARWCTNARWFDRPANVPFSTSYTRCCMSGARMRALVRFRVGSHDLPVERGRHAGLPRCARVCERCCTGQVGDEMHVVFECPALEDIRRRYRCLFTRDTCTMRLFMWQADQRKLASFLLACLGFPGDWLSCA